MSGTAVVYFADDILMILILFFISGPERRCVRPVYDRTRVANTTYNNVLFRGSAAWAGEHIFSPLVDIYIFAFWGRHDGPSSSSTVFIPFLGIRGMRAHICVVSRKIERIMDVN